MGQLEKFVASPFADSSQIAQLVSHMPSSTVDSPRNLSTDLLSRLEEIAALNNNRVPLHGRLFAQWMHHAYPRECSFPHETGTTKPMLPGQWAIGGGAATMKQSAMESFHKHASSPSKSAVRALPWMEGEELIMQEPAPGGHFGSVPAGLFHVIMSAAA